FNVSRFNLNADCSGSRQDRSEKTEVAQSGTKIDEHIIGREAGAFNHREYMFNRRRLIQNLFRDWFDGFMQGRSNPQDSRDQLVETIVTRAGNYIVRSVSTQADPVAQTVRIALTDTASNRAVNFGIGSFESAAQSCFALER